MDTRLRRANGLARKLAVCQSAGTEVRALRGEDPRSRCRTDATYWASTYKTLLQIHEQLLQDARELGDPAGRSPGAPSELDQEILSLKVEWLRLRLRFWEDRLGPGSEAAAERRLTRSRPS